MAITFRNAALRTGGQAEPPTREQRLDAYMRSGAKRVRGFLEPGATILITAIARAQESFDVHGHMAEIGVHQGRAFLLLHLLRRPGERSVAVDVFGHQDLNLDESGRGDLAIFRRNLRRHAGGTDDVSIIEGDSTKLTVDDYVRAAGGQFRLFHVDGGHMAHMAKHDMEQAEGALAEGGVIVLDDYFHEQWPGVSDGTRELFAERPEMNLVPFAIGGNKVFFARRGWAERYRKYLAALDIEQQGYGKPSVMMGEPVLTFAFWRMGPRDRLIRTQWWKDIRSKPGITHARRALRRRQGRSTDV